MDLGVGVGWGLKGVRARWGERRRRGGENEVNLCRGGVGEAEEGLHQGERS